jgi:putative redox protein
MTKKSNATVSGTDDKRGAVSEGSALARTAIDSFRTDIEAGSHQLIADEPASAGGTDLGPSPYGLLSAALASCTTMTLKMYASFKKLDLQSVSAHVTHEKIHAKDCADCESETGRIDTFHRVLRYEGNLTEEQERKLLEIADKCPVHKTLHGEINITTELT